ncbi:DEHA2G20064p [Debaryomyces hansenii CBS767]|uniref:DEHA2G20064p n=1 Tax=Debaryomyces hansenii (strain ATCC 36239 / CBS 767 / BCRC 21394 / JCM 1990 / NBRC 0083 / IGC 2968) TaxID=284592 RepID=B5RUW3_DEBHA|nr:DEHA2G20064p [Debaryomyces hansenii CBS767]CAR66007.1 DEHA2G20064p [Debaryomyces hansenii CBS767]|eukprot:XP_002770675.1 DEHA2G20064p [Debaryomyces hansenii CBS767]
MFIKARLPLGLQASRNFYKRNQVRHFSVDPHAIISTLTDSLQSVHAYSGIPWWALIPVTTFALRSVWTLPLAIMQRKRIQKQTELRPIISAMNPVLKLNLAKKVQSAKQKAEKSLGNIQGVGTKDQSIENVVNLQSPVATMKYEEILLLATKETRKRQKALFKKHDVQLWKNIILPAFQIPLWVCMSWTMRDLSGWSSWDSLANKPLDSSLYTEGLFWFTDLTTLDPMHIFPLILGVISLCNVEWTFKTLELSRFTRKRLGRPTLTDSMSSVARMSVVFMMAISLNAPVALTLYWLSSQVYSLIQNIILDLMIPISFTPNKRFGYKTSSKSNKPVSVVNTN